MSHLEMYAILIGITTLGATFLSIIICWIIQVLAKFHAAAILSLNSCHQPKSVKMRNLVWSLSCLNCANKRFFLHICVSLILESLVYDRTLRTYCGIAMQRNMQLDGWLASVIAQPKKDQSTCMSVLNTLHTWFRVVGLHIDIKTAPLGIGCSSQVYPLH